MPSWKNGVAIMLGVGFILAMASSLSRSDGQLLVTRASKEAQYAAHQAVAAAERAEALAVQLTKATAQLQATQQQVLASMQKADGAAQQMIASAGQVQAEARMMASAAQKITTAEPPYNISAKDANCPEEALYLAMWILKRAKKGHVWRIADVGVNKGYTLASMLSAMKVPEYSPPDLAQEMMEYIGYDKFTMGQCGACCDCVDVFDWNKMRDHPWYKAIGSAEYKARVGGVQVWGVDPTQAHVNWNRKYYSKPGIPTPLNFTFVRAFASGTTGSVKFRDGVFLGRETTTLKNMGRGMDRQGEVPEEDVPIVTVDSVIPADIPELDFLITDVEGFDWQVRSGASRFVPTGNVGIYQFELHLPPNAASLPQLGAVVKDLEGFGYQCYVPVIGDRRRVFRVSASAWQPEWDSKLRGWKNLVCANVRKYPELNEVFGELENMLRPEKEIRHWKTCSIRGQFKSSAAPMKAWFEEHVWKDAGRPEDDE